MFQNDPQTNRYTPDAISLQYLLRYSDKPKFKKTELYNWVIRNDPKYVQYYTGSSLRNTPYNKRLHDNKEGLDTNFETLLQLKLIHKTGIAPAEKLQSYPVGLFEYTKGGILLRLIL